MGQTFGERIAEMMDAHFVGREFELEYFRHWLANLEERNERILNLFGSTGMGKTYLLGRYARIAEELGAAYLSVDIRDAMGRPERLLESLLGQSEEDDRTEDPLLVKCHRLLNGLAVKRRVVLAFDGYEEIGALDHWMRTVFLPGLHENTLVLISGRFPLEGPWRHAPAWKKLIVRLPLQALDYEDIRSYLRRWGIEEETAADSVWLRTLGHPLALSLLTPLPPDSPRAAFPPEDKPSGEPLQALLDGWLKEAPSDELRRLLFAASSVHAFHQELLSHVLGEEVPPTRFQSLTDLSFVVRTAAGWQLQELVRETLQRQFRERMPDTSDAYRNRAAEYYKSKLEEGLSSGKDVLREFAEWLRYADNAVLRAHYRHARESRNYTEPLTEENLGEAKEYVRRRLREEKPSKVLCSDPVSGESFRFELGAELGRARLALVPLEELMTAGEDAVRLLRSPAGRIVGLFAFIPVYGRTYDWLARAPVSRAYIASLTAEESKRIRESKEDTGIRYVYAMDLAHLEMEELRSDLIHALLDPILAGHQLVESPPPHDYFRLGKLSLGFEPLPGAEHSDYGGELAPTYVLDTRREKLRRLLDRLNRGANGTSAAFVADEAAPVSSPELTLRERDVAGWLMKGLTNAEIASRLYISEAAVKKHVNSMLSKYGLRNRTELANYFHHNINGGASS